jgi:hypothetical protein
MIQRNVSNCYHVTQTDENKYTYKYNLTQYKKYAFVTQEIEIKHLEVSDLHGQVTQW